MVDTAYLAHSPAAKQWKEIGIYNHHGIAVPLFSIHSQNSSGIGEFPDLIPLIDWCQSIGFDIIQLLPLNDMGLGTSPYSALSAFALDPTYLGLHALPYLEESSFLQEELKAIPQFATHPRIDYQRIREHKAHFLYHYYSFAGPRLLKSLAYRSFVKEASWLKGYALFKILDERYQWKTWEAWPSEAQVFSPALLDQLSPSEQEKFNWHCLLQFLCDQQMQAAKKYASQQGVYLMGDVPILVDRNSADVWQERTLFNLNYSAGSPPDMFANEGQNWGFPIYNWEQMAQQGFHWWIERLKWLERYNHLYRIDHILGFFRIWAIPIGQKGTEGFFLPKDPATWIELGQRTLMTMLNHCNMLPIGEDLGSIVPPEVKACLSALGICGTRIMRWEREWDEKDKPFILPEDYHLDTMTSVSTHDSEILQQWWQNNPEEAQAFAYSKGWSYQHLLSHSHHLEILWDSHHTHSLFHINPIQEYLALVPGLSWPHLSEERINIPGLLSENNWSYRMRPSLEELAKQETLKHVIQELIK